VKNRTIIILIGLIFCALVSASWAEDADNASRVVAEIGSQKITLGQVRQRQPARLLEGEYSYYQAERDAISEVLDQELLANEARRENLTVDKLYDRQVKSRIKIPTEAQLKFYYDTLGASQSFDALRQKISDRIVRTQEQKLLADYVASLRAKENARILLRPPKLEVTLGDAPVIGSKDAPVTMVEFADFECPYCRQTEPNLQKLREQFPDKLRIVYKNFPLPIHSHAQKAAEAGVCAGEQGKFWPYHDKLMAQTPPELEVPQLKAVAASLKLDTARFDQCLDSGKEATAVSHDLEQGKTLGISGTPGFFINGYFLSGAAPYNTMRDLVEQQLAPVPAQAAASGHGLASSAR
jgi:protein-disulfide isomerase